MVTTHDIGEGAGTVGVHGVPDPSEQYGYAAVLEVGGPLAIGLCRSVETAVREVLADRRAASWTWIDDRAMSVRFTRSDPEYAAATVGDVLDRLEERFASDRESFDDPAFDRALGADGWDDGGG